MAQDQTKYQQQEVIIKGTPAMFAAMVESWALRLWQSGRFEEMGYLMDGTGPAFWVYKEHHWPSGTIPPDTPAVDIRVTPPRYESDQIGQLPEGHVNRFGWITVRALPGNQSQVILAYPETEPRLLTPWTLLFEEMGRLGFIEPKAPTDNDTPQAQLEGKHPCKVTFYLDNTTVRYAATWLSTNLSQIGEPNRWTYTSGYLQDRRYLITPVKEAIDKQGRILLTVGLIEREAGNLVESGIFNINPSGAMVSSNPRAIEILVIPKETDQAQVFAACNALLLLHKFTDLLWYAKTAYGDKLKQLHPHYGVMDVPTPDDSENSEELRQYFRQEAERFQEVIAAIESPSAVNETPRDNEPEGIDGGDGAPMAKYPYSLTLEDETKLRRLWPDDNLSLDDMAIEFKVSIDRIKDYKTMYQLPDRKRGRKPLK